MSNNRNKRIGEYTRMFAALSNPHRAAILLRLANGCCGDAYGGRHDQMRTCVGDVARHLKLAASTVSHHIRELHQAGLIQVERRGRTVECCVDAEAVRALADFLDRAVGQTPTPERKKA